MRFTTNSLHNSVQFLLSELSCKKLLPETDTHPAACCNGKDEHVSVICSCNETAVRCCDFLESYLAPQSDVCHTLCLQATAMLHMYVLW